MSESIYSFWSPDLRVIAFLGYGSNRRHKGGEVQNKLPIIVGKTHEMLNSMKTHQGAANEEQQTVFSGSMRNPGSDIT